MKNGTMTVGDLKAALSKLNDDAEVLVMGINDGDLIAIKGIDNEDSYNGVVGLNVAHTFPEHWFYIDSKGSRWDKDER